MVKKETKEKEEVIEDTKATLQTEISSDYKNLLEIYQKQNPVKYASKEAELKRKLEANK
jgi:hypothetical protein